MAEARVVRPKGILKADWDLFIDRLGEYRALDPGEPDYEVLLQEKAEQIADQAEELFLVPLTP